jgi:hypothetical protein
MAKIVLAGGTGLIGTKLVEHYDNGINEIFILTRRESSSIGKISYVNWNGIAEEKHKTIFENSDIVINLTGKSINCRHTEENLAEILNSRVDSTASIAKLINQCKNPPKMWMNSSAIAIYANTFDNKLDEYSNKYGQDNLAIICKKWEDAVDSVALSSTNKVILRTGIVLANEDGAFPVLAKLTKYGLGGTQGSGKQFLSWIHIDDLTNAVDYIYKNKLDGIFNLVAPNAVDNKHFMKQMRESFKVSVGLPAPSIFVKIGSKIIGTESKLVLESHHIYPKRLLENKFQFRFNVLKEAIENLRK